MSIFLRNYLLVIFISVFFVAGCNPGSTKSEVSGTPEQDVQQGVETEEADSMTSIQTSVNSVAGDNMTPQKIRQIISILEFQLTTGEQIPGDISPQQVTELLEIFKSMLATEGQDTVKLSPQQVTALFKLLASQPVAEAEVTDKVEAELVVSADASGEGVLSVEKNIYDFGSIEPGGLKYGVFKLKNVGEGNLVIDRVTAPCRCTVPQLPKMNLAPGESVDLKFTFDVGTAYGKVSKTIDVATKSPSQPANTTLFITAEVRKIIDVEPAIIVLGMDKDYENTGVLTVSSTDGSEFHITGYLCTGDPITLKYDPTVKARMHKLTYTANLDNLRKIPSAIITIKTDHPTIERLTLRYNTKMPFEVFPRTKRFMPETQAGRQTKIKVVSNFGKDFELGEIYSKNGFVKVLETGKSVDGYEILVELDVDKAKEQDSSIKTVSDYLHIQIAGHPEDTLDVMCYGLIK